MALVGEAVTSGHDTDLAADHGRGNRREWQTRYVRRIVAGDVMAAVLSSAVAFLIRFGPEASLSTWQQDSAWFALCLPVAWVVAMLVGRSYETRFLFVGSEEFRRVFDAAILLVAVFGVIGWGLRLEIARGFVIVALPLATVLSLLQRYGQRRWLHRQRVAGRHQQTLLVVGHRPGVAALHAQIAREAYQGYRVVGACLPPGTADAPRLADGLPVLGSFDSVVDVVRRYGVDTVAVLPSPELDGPSLRRLGWELESTDAELLLAPAVTEVVGPRINIRPVCGLPLMHMERPELRGVRRVVKTVSDMVMSSLVLLVLLPALVAIALAVRLTSSGPVFFLQERVGKDGRPFKMIKFRTMVDGAHSMVQTLAPVDDGNGVLFKLREDPRVTRVGRVLRRYSLDELPQLFNVLRGEMSLVGPRPPLPSEVEKYGSDMRRRLLVKPGLTGLWQVSGRSDLSWDDSVRIDIRYVENWSLSFDFMIMWKTLGAVFRGSGAY